MASIVKVDTIQDQDGNNIINENADTITIGASGDTITIPTILKVDTIQDQDGNNIINESANTITIGASGDTINLASGATAGFGKIAQVIQVVDDTEVSITSTSHTDTGLSASIVPSSTSSKILVKVVHQCYFTRATDAVFGGVKLLRNTTEIFNPIVENATGPYGLGINVDNSGSTLTQIYWNIPLEYLDSPNTTSSITYKTQARLYQSSNNGQIVFNDNSTINDGKSIMTLMEVLP